MDVKLPPPLIVLPKQELTALMPFGEYVDAVADAFRMHAEGRSVSPPPMHIPADGGGFHVKAGSLRGLGVTTLTRSPAIPDVPAVAETLPDFDASSWFGLVAPKGTPRDIVDRLNKELNAALATPDAKARVAEIGGTVIEGSAESFGDFLTRETKRWGDVVRVSGAKAE